MEIRKGLIRPFASRFFAGETLSDGLERVGLANTLGMSATLDFLGENAAGRGEAELALAEYVRMVEALSGQGLDSSVAVKMTHIGLEFDRPLAFSGLSSIGEAAARAGVSIWLDMEGSRYTDDVIAAHEALARVQPDCGIAIQAALWRSWSDLRALTGRGARVRLVKGAYREPDSVASGSQAAIRERFVAMMEYLFANSPGGFAIGTHDPEIIELAQKAEHDVDCAIEYQMLMGMRDGLKRRLVGEGKRVVEYIPYGTEWYGYGMRRLMEKRRNILRLAEGLAGR